VTLRVLGTNSAIYAATTLVQKGAAFLLMPLYTLYLEPAAFGVIAIVTAVNGFLTIAFTLGLTGAVTRFYFEYQEQPEQLAEFWGSVLTLVIVMSTLLAGALLLIGEHLLRPVLGGVPFWPYVHHDVPVGAAGTQPAGPLRTGLVVELRADDVADDRVRSVSRLGR
jgi:O-antigen/teichoic acid export membrane protein